MRELGFDGFAVVGHDRGARVAHRMALDYPRSVARLAVLDIVHHQARAADRRQGLRPRLLALVLPRPAGAAAATPDRRRTGRLGARPMRNWRRGGSRSTPGRSTSTSAASPSRPRSTPLARTTGPPSAPTWTTMTPRPPAARRSSPRCSPVGRSTASSAVITATSRPSGASTRKNVQGRSLPAGHFLAEECPQGDNRRPAGFPQGFKAKVSSHQNGVRAPPSRATTPLAASRSSSVARNARVIAATAQARRVTAPTARTASRWPSSRCGTGGGAARPPRPAGRAPLRVALGARRDWYPASAAATASGPGQSASAPASAAASSIACSALGEVSGHRVHRVAEQAARPGRRSTRASGSQSSMRQALVPAQQAHRGAHRLGWPRRTPRPAPSGPPPGPGPGPGVPGRRRPGMRRRPRGYRWLLNTATCSYASPTRTGGVPVKCASGRSRRPPRHRGRRRRSGVYRDRPAVSGPPSPDGSPAPDAARGANRPRPVGRQHDVGGVHPPVAAGHDRAAHDRESELGLVDRGDLAAGPQLDVRVRARVGEHGRAGRPGRSRRTVPRSAQLTGRPGQARRARRRCPGRAAPPGAAASRGRVTWSRRPSRASTAVAFGARRRPGPPLSEPGRALEHLDPMAAQGECQRGR